MKKGNVVLTPSLNCKPWFEITGLTIAKAPPGTIYPRPSREDIEELAKITIIHSDGTEESIHMDLPFEKKNFPS